MIIIHYPNGPMNNADLLQARLQALTNAADCALWVQRYLEWCDTEPSVPCDATHPMPPIAKRPLRERVLV